MATPSFVIFDVETTGLEPAEGHEIIEIGAQKLIGNNVAGEFVRLLKPSRPIPADSMAIHGITNEQVQAEGQNPSEVIPELVEFFGDSIIVAHNAPFDIGFVNAHLDRLGLPRIKNQVLDTIEIAKRYLILPSYRLQNVAKYLKIPQPKAHRALVDVETTRDVFLKLIERAKQK